MGRLRPVNVKFAPDMVAWLMVTLEPPEFVRVTAWVWLVPTGTPLKVTIEGFAESCPLAANKVEERATTANSEGKIPNRTLLHFKGENFTARPLAPR